MKKYASVAALALRMTFLPVLLAILAVCALQWFSVDPMYYLDWSFEHQLEGFRSFLNPTFLGRSGAAVILIVLMLTGTGGRGARSRYTLGRLGISETGVTVTFCLVFTGYFLLYWVIQLGLVLALYDRYARWTVPGPNALFLAAYRSEYFHMLLPLRDWWGYVRNILMCLSFGSGAGLALHRLRRGKGSIPMLMAPVFLAAVWMPLDPASQTLDILLSILFAAYIIGFGWLVFRGDHNEDS